jgi:hypothetical protein
MSYSQSWLQDPSAIRMLLVVAKVFNVLTNQEESIYLSTTGYTTSDGVAFYPVIVGNIQLTESFGAEDSVSMTWGDVEITNKNGEYDKYLDSSKYVWSNRELIMYYGDPGWTSTLSNIPTIFLKIFDGVIEDCDSRNIQSFNLKLRDKLERLNGPLSEAVVGTYGVWPSGQQNKDQLKPVIFGEVFNTTPVLIDPAQLEYLYSCSNPNKLSAGQTNAISTNGASELLIEVRDNGAPIYIYSDTVNYGGAVANNSNSTFKLTSPPSGEITVSVQGVKISVDLDNGTVLNGTYTNTIANLIATIVMSFGKASTRFTAADVDWVNFKQFDTQNPVPAGVLIEGNTNVLEACQSLALSIGANICMSREGKLRILKFGEPYGTSVTVTPDDMVFDTLEISNRLVPSSAKAINWGKNWTVQTNLTTAIPADHKQSFAREWLTVTAKDETVAQRYKSEVETIPKNTLLINEANASQEATRLLNYYKVQKTFYRFRGTPRLLSLSLGQPVLLKHHRFGLDNGVSGQVVSLSPDWLSGYIDVEVLV